MVDGWLFPWKQLHSGVELSQLKSPHSPKNIINVIIHYRHVEENHSNLSHYNTHEDDEDMLIFRRCNEDTNLKSNKPFAMLTEIFNRILQTLWSRIINDRNAIILSDSYIHSKNTLLVTNRRRRSKSSSVLFICLSRLDLVSCEDAALIHSWLSYVTTVNLSLHVQYILTWHFTAQSLPYSW